MYSDRNQGLLAIMIAHNELKCVKLNVRILLEELKGTGSELLVVDNYSQDGLSEWLTEQKQISSVIIEDKMEGFGKILSFIKEEFGSERDFLILRANYFFTPGSILSMKEILDTEKDIAAVGPVCNVFAGEQYCSGADTYAKAEDLRQRLSAEEMVRTVRLDTDVMMIRSNTFMIPDESICIPKTVMRGYMRTALEKGNCFAAAKSAVCFAICQTDDSPYRGFAPKLYSKEKLQQLLYSFGDITYKGVHLYKYLEPDILLGVNGHDRSHNSQKNIESVLWDQADHVEVSTEEEADQTNEMLDSLPQKDVLFVTLPLRRMYKGQLIHTAMESFIDSLDEEKYLDIEYVSDIKQDTQLKIPTKNRYPVLETAIPRIYGLSETDGEELFRFLRNDFIHPLEEALDIRFEERVLRGCFYKAAYVLKLRDAYLRFYKKVLKKVKPKVIIYSHGQNVLLTYLRDVSLELNIPTLEIAHGVLIPGPYHKHLAYADYLVVFHPWIADRSRLAGNDRVIGTGKPGVYVYDKELDKKDFKIVITFVSSLETELLEYAKNLARKLDKQKYLVIYKIHGAEMWSKSEMEAVKRELANFQFASGRLDIRDMVSMSDIVVGIQSSGIFDALPYPMVKVITIRDRSEYIAVTEQKEILQLAAETGETVMVENEEELIREVVHYKRNVMYRKIPNSFWPYDAEEKFRELVNSFQ